MLVGSGMGSETHAHVKALGWAAMKLHDSTEGPPEQSSLPLRTSSAI